MNHPVTSKEQLLKAAKEIAYNDGLAKVSIRSIASACNVSVGSIYNYFPTKAELIAAVIEDFWKTAFHGQSLDVQKNESFTNYFERIYLLFFERLTLFRMDLLAQMTSLKQEEKNQGRRLESEYFNYMKKELTTALENDTTIQLGLWHEHFTKDAFIHFVFSNMIQLLKQGNKDCSFFKEVLNHILYL